jgi:hypothetical protein
MTNPFIEIIGVYKIKASDPCHLIELFIHNSTHRIDMMKYTQEIPGVPAFNWQVPYGDKFLNSEGTEVIGDVMIDGIRNEELWLGSVRMAFFFHYLDLSKPLQTPFGIVKLPNEARRPRRLKCMKYIPVD